MKMTTNDRKYYLGYLNVVVDEYNNTYQCFVSNKFFHVNFSALPKEFESIHKAPKSDY